MSERFQTDVSDFRAPILVKLFRPLPGWLADRLLKAGEKVTWVRGPRFNPAWERYVTHPALALFLLGLVLGTAIVALGCLHLDSRPDIAVYMTVAFCLVVVPSIIVLGIANGYFTRLVVTNCRLVILQGYEICRSWNIDDLPASLICYTRRGGEVQRPCIDLEAVKIMLGGSSDQFTSAKTILAFGKQLDRIQTRDGNRG